MSLVVQITPACFPEDASQVQILLREYRDFYDTGNCFSKLEDELATLPTYYSPPKGQFFVARLDGQIIGSVALRPLTDIDGEIKRLFLRAPYRRKGIGTALMNHIIQEAKAIGYHRILLDTLPSQIEAQRLYRKLGFEEIEPYWTSQIPNLTYFVLLLKKDPS
jgi:putative acetyltransferase